MAQAQEHRFEAEITARAAGRSPEVVVLSAKDKETIRETHAKYFGVTELRDAISRAQSQTKPPLT